MTMDIATQIFTILKQPDNKHLTKVGVNFISLNLQRNVKPFFFFKITTWSQVNGLLYMRTV